MTRRPWTPKQRDERASFQDEVAEIATRLAQVSLNDQEYLVVDAETLDTQTAGREEVTKDLEEGNCELASHGRKGPG